MQLKGVRKKVSCRCVRKLIKRKWNIIFLDFVMFCAFCWLVKICNLAVIYVLILNKYLLSQHIFCSWFYNFFPWKTALMKHNCQALHSLDLDVLWYGRLGSFLGRLHPLFSPITDSSVQEWEKERKSNIILQTPSLVVQWLRLPWFHCKVQVQFLGGELRYHMPSGTVKKKFFN